MLRLLSEDVPVQKDPLPGEFFDQYGANYVKKGKNCKKKKIALITACYCQLCENLGKLAMAVLTPLSEEVPV